MTTPQIIASLDRVMDHRILHLRSATTGVGVRFSWYHFTYTAQGPTGNLAFWQMFDGAPERAVLTDSRQLYEALGPTIGTPDYRKPFLALDPIDASFTVGPLGERHVCVVEAPAMHLELTWEGLASPVFAFGPTPARPEEYDIHSLLIEAADGSFAQNGKVLDAAAFPDDMWTAWMGRPMSSAILGLGEVVYRRPDAAGGQHDAGAAGSSR